MRRGSLLTTLSAIPFGVLSPYSASQSGLISSGNYRQASCASPKAGTLLRVRALTATTPEDNFKIFTINPTSMVCTALSGPFTVGSNQIDVNPNIAIANGDVVGFYFPTAATRLVYGFTAGSTYYYSGGSSQPVPTSTEPAWSGNVSSLALIEGWVM